MKIHEYQAKEILKKYGVHIPEGKVTDKSSEAKKIAEEIGKPVVIKAQVLVGGRGKAGGVKIANTPKEAEEIAGKILGMNIKGEIVKKVLVTEAIDIKSEAYLGIIVDRDTKKSVIMVSAAGGVDIEEVARVTPEKIHKFAVDSCTGLLTHQARELGFKIYEDGNVVSQSANILMKLYQAFVESDASLAEINPLVVTKSGEVWAVDAKMNIDDNGLFRHPDIEAMREVSPDEATEVEAKEKDLTYIKLSGNIGCIVNGAGLAMATMDIIKRYGGEPANFLDIGGSSSPEKVANAMDILLRDKNVKAIFFNIFGGITRCDDVAQGIVDVTSKMKINVPIVVRLTGTNEEIAKDILKKTTFLVPASSMSEGAKKAIELAKTIK